MAQFLAPICNDQTFDANGDPLVGGQIETYIAESSTPAATYTDDTGGTPQSNPIILNSLGYPTLGPIWLTGGISYKFIIKNAAGATLRTIDNISGVNDASVSQSEWVESGFVPTYISGTSFSVPGDQTAILQIGRRLRTTNTSGLVYSTISNSVFAAGITTVTLTNDSTNLDAGLSLIAYALLAASPLSVPNLPASNITMATARILGRAAAGTGPGEELTGAEAQALLPVQQTRTDVASASTVDLTTAVPSNDNINITGTTTITAFTVAAGRMFFVRFNAALTLTNNANIVTQSGANITTVAGDTCILRATAANTVEVLSYSRASTISYALRAGGNFDGGAGTARTSNGLSITKNATGDYSFTLTTAAPSADYVAQVSASGAFATGWGFAPSMNTVNATGAEQAPTTTVFRVSFRRDGNIGYDPKYIYVSVFY